MKFLCEHCKAKYQIPDEKVAGRTLRMQCRKCGHDILIRGGGASDSIQAPRPMATLSSVVSAPSNVPSALSSPGTGPLSPVASPVPRTRATGSQAGPTPTRGASQTSALSADFRTKVQSTSLASEPPAPMPEEMWHVAINDVPVGPIRRDELARKIGVGVVTGESLVWREGFDDWRPLRDVAQLASLLRHLRAPPPSPPSSNESRLAPLGGRLGGAAAVEEQGFNDEATMVSQSPLEALEAKAAAPTARAAASTPAANAPAASTPAANAPAASTPAASAPAAKASSDRVVPRAAPVAQPSFDGLPPAVSEPPPAPLAPAAPIATAAVAAKPIVEAPVAPAAPLASVTTAPVIERRRGDRRQLPVGALMGIAFAAGAGLLFAYILATRLLDSDKPLEVVAVAPTTPAVPEVAPPPQVDIDTNVPTAAVAVAPTPAAPAAPEAANPAQRPSSGAHTATATAARPSTPAPAPTAHMTAEERAMMARFSEESGGGPSDINVARVAPTATARPLDGQAISTVVNRNKLMLQRCYERASRGMAEAPTTRMDITLRVAPSGAVTNANVTGTDFGGLVACIQSTVSRWRFPESAGGGDARFPMVFQGGG